MGFFQSILDGLSAHIAVLNDRGEIIFTNAAYRSFAERNGIDTSAVSEGANYLAVCDTAQGEYLEEAASFAQGIREVLDGRRPSFALEYPCHSPDEKRWFIGQVTPLPDNGRKLVIVSHENITERKRTEEVFDHFFEHPTRLNLMAHLDGVIHRANKGLEDLLGYGRGCLVGLNFLDFVHPDDQAATIAEMGRLAEGISTPYFENRYRQIDGKYRLLAWSAAAGVSNVDSLVLGIAIDITERKQAEEALLASSERLSIATRAGGVGIWDYDIVNNKMLWDAQMYSLYGITPDTFGGADEIWRATVHPEDMQRVDDEIQMLLNGEKAFDSEFRVRWPNETIHNIRASSIIKRDSSGKPLRMIGTNWDITQHKQAEEKLKESARQYRELFESSADALFVVASETGRIMDANRMASVLYGYELDELLTKQAADLSVESEETNRRILEAQSQPGQIAHIPLNMHRKKDGTVFPVEISARSLIRKGQSVILIDCRDITDIKRAEVEHENLQVQFLQAQKMEAIGRLAGGVAHDFNNLLTGIMAYTELSREKVAPHHPIQEYLGEIMHAAKQSADITQQLLAFARKQTIAPRVLDLNNAVAGMLKLLRRLIGENIQLTWRPCSDLRPVKVDPSQVHQIVANLCVNSRDAIAGVGEIVLETGRIEMDTAYCAIHPGEIPGAYVSLAISDNGCGMDKETLAHVFDPFFTTKDAGIGTGLGLATVYGIVKQNNGSIRVFSEPGKGTTFTIYLPEIAALVQEPDTTRAEVPKGRGETILLVEDEKSLRATCGLILEGLDYKVLVAETPGEALKLVAGNPGDIHVLLTDVIMPEMDGRQLAQRATAIKPDLKILFMSGYTSDVISQRGVLDEGVRFLAKPFTLNEIAHKVRETLAAD